MNNNIQITSNSSTGKKKNKKPKMKYKMLIYFIIAVLAITFLIYMLQTSVNDII